MITVAIYINGKPLYVRSAVRQSGGIGKTCEYLVDDGSVIKHEFNAGAIPLAKAMLDSINEPVPVDKHGNRQVNDDQDKGVLYASDRVDEQMRILDMVKDNVELLRKMYLID